MIKKSCINIYVFVLKNFFIHSLKLELSNSFYNLSFRIHCFYYLTFWYLSIYVYILICFIYLSQMIVPYRCYELRINRLKPAGDLGQLIFTPLSIRDDESIRQAVKYSNVVINLIGKDYHSRNFRMEEVIFHIYFFYLYLNFLVSS